MIRPVMPKDVFQLAELAKIMHKEGRYKDLNFNKKKLIDGFLWLMAQCLLVGFVEEKNDKIVGAVVGVIDTYFFGNDYILVDRGMYVLQEHRKGKTGAKLLRAYVDAGKKLGVKEIKIGSTNYDDPNAMDLLYKKVGFEKVGSVYKIEV